MSSPILPRRSRRIVVKMLAALAAPLAVVVSLGLVSEVSAQAADPANVVRGLTQVADCPADANVLVALAVTSVEAERASLVADLVNQLATVRDRRIDLLIGLGGAGFERFAGWEQVTPTSAAHQSRAVIDASAEAPGATDPTAVVAEADAEIDQEAARTDGPTCGVVVFDPGAPGETDSGEADAGTGPLAGDHDILVLSADPTELVVELASLATLIDGGAIRTDPVGVCSDQGCDEGTVAVELPPTIGNFSLTVVLPSDTASIEVGLPRGVTFPVDDRRGGSISAGSFTLNATWPNPQVVRLQAEVSPTDTDWAGPWTVTVVDSEARDADTGATFITTMASGIVPRFTGSVRLVAGREVILRAELLDRRDDLVSHSGALESVAMTARVLDPTGGELASTDLAPNATGVWSGGLALAADVGVDEVTLELVADIVSAPVALPTARFSTSVDVLPTSVWPSVDTTELMVRADAGSTATEAVSITAGTGVDACAWIDDATVGLGATQAAVGLAGGARSPASCVRIPADSTASIPLTVDLADVTPGAYVGSVNLAYGPMGDDAFDTVEVSLTFEVLAPVNVARRVQITVGMALIALVVPLLALWLLDWIKARFRPSRRAVAAEVWVAVWSDGSIYRVDTDGSPLLLGNDDFEPAGLSRTRRFRWRGLDLGVRNPTSPLTPPVAVVGSDQAPVVASMGAVVDEDSVVGRVPLNLAPTWIFELAPEATREAALDPTAPDFFASYGRLILIRPALDAPPVDISELAEMAHRLALTVRRATRADSGTAQEMLDFVEANASAPRDLPRRQDADEVAAAEAAEAAATAAAAFGEPRPSALPSSDPYDFSDLAGLFADDETDPVADSAQPAGSGQPDSGVDEPEREQADATDPGPTDDWDDIEVEASPGYGVVFEEEVNPEAFRLASGPGARPASQSSPPSEPASPPEPAPDERPSDPRTSWARRSKPNWPSAGRRPDA